MSHSDSHAAYRVCGILALPQIVSQSNSVVARCVILNGCPYQQIVARGELATANFHPRDWATLWHCCLGVIALKKHHMIYMYKYLLIYQICTKNVQKIRPSELWDRSNGFGGPVPKKLM